MCTTSPRGGHAGPGPAVDRMATFNHPRQRTGEWFQRRKRSRWRTWSLALIAMLLAPTTPLVAQTSPDEPPPTADELRDDELAISGRYSRFERLLSQMADILGREDPERAELLRRAVSKGREEKISERLNAVITLLESRELGSAIEQQEGVTESLRTLLTLLQSEDRRSSVERERERLNDLLNDVRGLVEAERSARAAARNAETPSGAAAGQQRVIDDADALIDDVDRHDRSAEADAEQSSDAESPGDSGTPPDDPAQSPPGDQNSPPGQDSESTPSDNPSSETTPSENPPSEGQNSSGSPSGDSSRKSGEGGQQTPGRQQLESARRAMQEALDHLLEQQRDEAADDQDEAIAELLKAANELEEMLRQLREEEKEMILAALEARFQRMLALETRIHEGTLELAETPKDEWLDQYFGRCRELAQQQTEVAVECSRTAGLLREDGTSVSILLAVEGIESDMQSAAGWLQNSDVGPLTQSVQTDILDALRELIEATQREMEEMQSERNQSQQQSEGDPRKPPLVDLMAEIKVLRSLQMRVNRRTQQVDGLLQQNPADPEPLQTQLSELAVRQQRLIESARELAQQMDPH